MYYVDMMVPRELGKSHADATCKLNVDVALYNWSKLKGNNFQSKRWIEIFISPEISRQIDCNDAICFEFC